MDYPNKNERQIEIVVKILLVAVVFFGALATMSCTPEGCWECQNVMVNNVISEVCWEYDCNAE